MIAFLQRLCVLKLSYALAQTFNALSALPKNFVYYIAFA